MAERVAILGTAWPARRLCDGLQVYGFGLGGDPQFVVSEYRTAVAESEVQTETAPGKAFRIPPTECLASDLLRAGPEMGNFSRPR